MYARAAAQVSLRTSEVLEMSGSQTERLTLFEQAIIDGVREHAHAWAQEASAHQ